MKTGDIVMIYVDPHKCRVPIGEAKLIELIQDYPTCEFWKVEYNDNGKLAEVLIKKEDESI
jgi:hypothetical protein